MSASASGKRPRPSLAEPQRSLVVIAYDISEDRVRSRVANTILSYGGRIQGSVYEVWITDRQLERLWATLGGLVKPSDLLRAYTLCAACTDRTRSYGMEGPQWAPGIIL